MVFSYIQINLPDSVTERCDHSLSTFIMGSNCAWFIAVGGGITPGTPVTDPNITTLVEIGK